MGRIDAIKLRAGSYSSDICIAPQIRFAFQMFARDKESQLWVTTHGNSESSPTQLSVYVYIYMIEIHVPKVFGRISGDNSLCIFKKMPSQGTKLGSYFNCHSLCNISEDQPNGISGSRCYEWFCGPDKFSGLARNGPLIFFSVLF